VGRFGRPCAAFADAKMVGGFIDHGTPKLGTALRRRVLAKPVFKDVRAIARVKDARRAPRSGRFFKEKPVLDARNRPLRLASRFACGTGRTKALPDSASSKAARGSRPSPKGRGVSAQCPPPRPKKREGRRSVSMPLSPQGRGVGVRGGRGALGSVALKGLSFGPLTPGPSPHGDRGGGNAPFPKCETGERGALFALCPARRYRLEP
jgi:hypothetical protein